MMSHARISAAVGVLPTPYVGDCANAAPDARSTRGIRLRAALNRIVNTPIRRDSPRLNRVVHAPHAGRLTWSAGVDRTLSPERARLGARRLHLAQFVRGA